MALTDLQILWIDGDTFKQLAGNNQVKTMLRLLIAKANTLSFSAFEGQGPDFATSPVFTFLPLKDSGVSWKPGEYLGNQKIGGNRVKRIKNAISGSKPHVILEPSLDEEFEQHIVFKILVGNTNDYNRDNKDFLDKFATFGRTNPSPPRNSGEIDQ